MSEPTDITDRLRAMEPCQSHDWKIAREAADEIERLQRLVGDMLHAQHRQERTNILQKAEIERQRRLIDQLEFIIRDMERRRP